MFIDRVVVQIIAGKGGNGVVAWRREKFIPKGGPTGGNGGNGGSVFLEATDQLSSLDAFRNRAILKAENGACGGPNCRTGRRGKDLRINIPVGTLIKDSKTGEVLFDCTEPGQRFCIAKGGIGGRGNDSFKTPTNRAPNNWTPGTPGEDLSIELELKLIADVGLIGFPNAGKSTLLHTLSHVNVKIAAYPFTTLYPHLGHLHYPDGGRILIADIPGIIEGAHANRGLGLEFLRHIERTQLLLYVLDASGIDGRTPTEDYRILIEELTRYNPALLTRPSIVLLNKTETEESIPLVEEFLRTYPMPDSKLFCISAQQAIGLEPVLEAIERDIGHCKRFSSKRMRLNLETAAAAEEQARTQAQAAIDASDATDSIDSEEESSF